MPKLGENAFYFEALNARFRAGEMHTRTFEARYDVRTFLNGMGQNVLGMGRNCVVVEDPNDPTKALALFKDLLSPRMAKTQFYMQKAYSTLFPNNFPPFYAAFGNWDTKIVGTIRQRIYPSLNTEIKYPFSAVEETCKKLGIPYGGSAGMDLAFVNFMVGSDGGQYYMDSIEPEFLRFQDFAPAKLGPRMEAMGYSAQDQQTVFQSIQRVRDLHYTRQSPF